MSAPIFEDLEAQALQNRKVRMAQMEADLAYFQARLELIGAPHTLHQQAQQRLFSLLHNSIGSRIVKARHRMLEDNKRRRI